MKPPLLFCAAAWLGTALPVGAGGSSESLDALVARGRAQYLAGDEAVAGATFRDVQVRDPMNAAAGEFLARIARAERTNAARRMLKDVEQAWAKPAPFVGQPARDRVVAPQAPLHAKLDAIVLPTVNFSGMELGRVVNTLSVVSAEFDRSTEGARGVNLVVIDPDNANPTVTLALRNVSFRRILDFLAGAVGYDYEVQSDAVVLRPATQVALETRFYPVSRSTVLRLIGRSAEPVVGTPTVSGTASVPAPATEGAAIRAFLQMAGIDFDSVTGSALAFDGSQLIATQTPRNLERIGNLLGRYRETRQVEIEAKFMEVQQGALEELGVQWNLAAKAAHAGTTRLGVDTGSGVNRSLAEAFRNATSSQLISISGAGQPEAGLNIPTPAPAIPGGVMLGTSAGPLATLSGVVGEFDVQATLRALSQKSGTELLSAPRLTVLSGNPATITVAQELRYPQSYGQIQSQVGTGSVSGGGSAGVSITSGTPQDFTTRNVGVELRVTPTVEEDDYSVSLELNPKVTEFEGFVEYGGPSVAISGGTTVTVPPGFYQPIFAVREVTTRVTVWDGATLVMGGLTREDVKKVSDKVPVLGNLPGVGRLFRSKGESSQKRNLLIFVTANLVTPGGGLKRSTAVAVGASEYFENPIIGGEGGPGERPGSGRK